MTLLKRIKIPLYYLKKRNNKEFVLEKLDTSVFVRSDDHVELIETKHTKKKPKERTSAKPGEFSVRICFENKSLTTSEQKDVRTVLSDALVTKKAHDFFHDLIVNAMEVAEDSDKGLLKTLSTLRNSKSLYHFNHRSSSKQSELYSIIPDHHIPR